MTILHLLILSIVQGITEFLPISSSAHLILVPIVMDAADQGVLLDIAAHVGTLAAVITYFWNDFCALVKGSFDILFIRNTSERKLACHILIGTIPAIIGGGALFLIDKELLRYLWILVATNFTFAGLLWLADKYSKNNKQMNEMTWKHALMIGMAQTVALIPGTSRSGITMTLSRFLGYTRTESARFSMVLSIPIILLAGCAALLEVIVYPSESVPLLHILIVLACSAITGIGAIHFLMRWLKRYSFLPFAIYRFVLGFLILFHILEFY